MRKIKVELTFPAKLIDKPIICELCKKIDVTVNIMEASFSTNTGWAILIIKGQDPEVNRAMEFLRSNGVEIGDTQENAA